MNPFMKMIGDRDKIAKKNSAWFDALKPEEQKEVSPFMLLRALTMTDDPSQIIRVNTCVNPYLFFVGIAKDQKPRTGDLVKLMAAASTGRARFFGSWIKAPGGKTKKMSLEVIMAYYDCSSREAASYKVAAEDLLEMAEELGYDKDELAKLKKEVDDGSGTTKKQVAKPKSPASRKRA